MTCEIQKIRIVKGDAKKLFTVNEPTLPSGWNLTGMNIQIGSLLKKYTQLVFPFDVSLSSEESLSLPTGINEVSILLFNGTLPQTAILSKQLQVIAEPQKVQQ